MTDTAVGNELESLLDLAAAARFFGKSERTISRRVADGLLPVVVVPGLKGVRFRAETLRKIAKVCEVPAVGGVRLGGAE